MINIESIVENDTDRCGNYITVQYEFPFPEESILQARKDEEIRYQMKKCTLIALSCENQSI